MGSDTRTTRAFTLIELLVVIAIIGVLLALLLPALSHARTAGRLAACLSNQKQLATAWELYATDFNVFPTVNRDDWWMKLRWGWGGVHWYGYDAAGNVIDMPDSNALPALSADRPINPYVAQGERVEASGGRGRGVGAFRCPSDGPLHMSRSRRSVDWSAFAQHSASDDSLVTAYGALGTSYEANSMLYAEFSGQGEDPQGTQWSRRAMGPRNVVVIPSHLVLLGDVGNLAAGTRSRSGRATSDIIVGWWHGIDQGPFAFLDGSARLVVLGDEYPTGFTYRRDRE